MKNNPSHKHRHLSTAPLLVPREIVERKWPPIRGEVFALLSERMSPYEAVGFLRTTLSILEHFCSSRMPFAEPTLEEEPPGRVN